MKHKIKVIDYDEFSGLAIWINIEMVIDEKLIYNFVHGKNIEYENNSFFVPLKYQYSIIRALYYNKSSSKWATTKIIKSLKNISVNPLVFSEYLTKIERTVASFYVRQLNSYLALRRDFEKKTGIVIYHKNDNHESYMDSLSILRNWAENHLDASNEVFIDFVHKNFDFPYSRDTLRRYFYENTKNKND